MIHVVLKKPDAFGPEGNVRVIGLEKSDMETLVQNGIMRIPFPSFTLALMYVSVSKEEFLSAINKEFGVGQSNTLEPGE